MKFLKPSLIALTLSATSLSHAYADVKVVTSIKPIHSLVASVMQGAGTPSLIVEGANSPHNYALKPSQARNLQEADIVFWMGHDLEAFLEGAVETIAKDAKSVSLMDSHGITKLAFREGGAFDAHDHGDHDDHDEHKHDEHGHDDHDEHGHDDHDEHKHDEHGHDDHDEHKHDEHGHDDHDEHKHDEHGHDDHDEHKHDEHGHDDHDEHKHDDHGHDDHDEHDSHDGHEGHNHGAFDPHLWLDPQNAKALVHEIEEHLVEIDPANAALYEANAANLMTQLDALTTELTAELAPVADKEYIVFHDAYQYFEKRFGLSAIGAITISPEVAPGADRISELQEKVRNLEAVCVFSEPQFQPKMVQLVTENTNAGTGVLDPLGASLQDGPDLYVTLIRNMAKSLKSCLSSHG